MPKITIADEALYYTDIGKATDKPCIVAIHGAAASHLVWPPELRRIQGGRVITPDLPGHGKSGGDSRDSIEAYAEIIGMMIQTLGIAPAIVIGHSMGGAIAQTLALENPSLVAGLVLIGTGPHLAVNPYLLETVQVDIEKVASLISKWAWGSTASENMRHLDREQILANPPKVVYEDYLACSRFDVRERLSEIQIPTLIIGGTADKMTPWPLSEALQAGISRSQLQQVEDGGHMMMLEQPAIVLAYLQTWLEEHFAA